MHNILLNGVNTTKWALLSFLGSKLINHCNSFVNSAFIRDLFPENLEAEKKGRPTTAGAKIKVRHQSKRQKIISLTQNTGNVWF